MSKLQVNDLVKINQTTGTAKDFHKVGDIVQVIKLVRTLESVQESIVMVKRLEQNVSDINSDSEIMLGNTFFMSELTKIGTVEDPQPYNHYLLGEHMSENERNELEQQLSDLLSNKRWLSQRITILNESLASFDQRKQKVKDELDEKMEQLAKYENSLKELIQKLQ